MRTPDKSWAAAIDEVKLQNSLTDDERDLLERLRDDPVTAKFKPSPGNVALVERLVRARRVAPGIKKEPEADRRLDEELKEIRSALSVLRDHGIIVKIRGARRLKYGIAFIDKAKPAISYEAFEVASDLPDDQALPQLNRQSSKENLFIRDGKRGDAGHLRQAA